MYLLIVKVCVVCLLYFYNVCINFFFILRISKLIIKMFEYMYLGSGRINENGGLYFFKGKRNLLVIGKESVYNIIYDVWEVNVIFLII